MRIVFLTVSHFLWGGKINLRISLVNNLKRIFACIYMQANTIFKIFLIYMINIHSGSATSNANYLLQHCPHIFSIFISVKRIHLLLLVEDASHQDEEHLERHFVHWVSFSVRTYASLLLSHGSIMWLRTATESLLECVSKISKNKDFCFSCLFWIGLLILGGVFVWFLCVFLVCCFVCLLFFPIRL